MLFPKPPKRERKKPKPIKRSGIKKKPKKDLVASVTASPLGENWLYKEFKKTKITPAKKKKRSSRIVDQKLLSEVRKQRCSSCGYPPGDEKNPIEASHITSRGAFGDDTKDNVAPKCRRCHRKWHQWGLTKFCNTFPGFVVWLIQNKRFDLLEKIGYHEENHEQKIEVKNGY